MKAEEGCSKCHARINWSVAGPYRREAIREVGACGCAAWSRTRYRRRLLQQGDELKAIGRLRE